MKKVILILALLFSTIIGEAQTAIPVCGQLNSFTGMTRGYHFTAPTTFIICGLYVEDDMSTLFQSVEIVRFTAGTPPAFAGNTNAFVTLFQNLNYAPNNMIAVPNVLINAGDIIGIYGSRGANSVNSYGNPNCGLTIFGNPTVAMRSGMQADLAAGPGMANIWSEVNYNIGRVTMFHDCVPLPIEILEFTGHNENKVNKLYWTTLSEMNNDFFTLERSIDGIEWNKIATILGEGNSDYEVSYTFNDKTFDNVINYYRLKQTDFNGTSEYMDILVSINNLETNKEDDLIRYNMLGQRVRKNYNGFYMTIDKDGKRQPK